MTQMTLAPEVGERRPVPGMNFDCLVLPGQSCALCGGQMLGWSLLPGNDVEYCAETQGHWRYRSASGWHQVDADTPVYGHYDNNGMRSVVFAGNRRPWHGAWPHEQQPEKFRRW